MISLQIGLKFISVDRNVVFGLVINGCIMFGVSFVDVVKNSDVVFFFGLIVVSVVILYVYFVLIDISLDKEVFLKLELVQEKLIFK